MFPLSAPWSDPGVGWPFVLVLLVAIRHRIEREEPHLRELFGSAYDAYARRTARLLPGVY